MNILFCQHNSICEPGIIRALKALGHTLFFPTHSFSHPDADEVYERLLSTQLHQESCDVVFSVNFIPVISEICEKQQVPYFCWIVDSPVIQLYSHTLLYNCNYVFIFDYILYNEFCQKNPGHIFYIPLGCDLELYDSIIPTAEDHAKYDCDVSFVGSLYNEKSPYHSIKSQLPAYIQGYFDGILNAQRIVYGYNFLCDIIPPNLMCTLEQVISISPSPGYTLDKRTLLGNLILNPMCTEMERIHLLNAIGEQFSLDLYTQSDTSPLKNISLKGIASSLDGMPKVFKCSKINLNLTAKGIQSGASLRIFDVLGCGGFLLSNYQAELPELFDVGKEIVLFESEKDLLEKISYYLEHDEEREAIAHNGYEKVKQEFSYRARLKLMLDVYSSLSLK